MTLLSPNDKDNIDYRRTFLSKLLCHGSKSRKGIYSFVDKLETNYGF